MSPALRVRETLRLPQDPLQHARLPWLCCHACVHPNPLLRTLRLCQLRQYLRLRLPLAAPRSPPLQHPRRFPALPSPALQTLSSSAALPDRSARTASRIPSTFCKESAAQSLPCAPLS